MPGKKILIVDNEDDQRRLMKDILNRLGYETYAAPDAQSALELIEEKDLRFIILDLIMPDIDGTELCEQIKNKSPKAVVYAFSGYITLYDPDKLKQAGFDGFIPKPVRIEKLQQIIDSVVDS